MQLQMHFLKQVVGSAQQMFPNDAQISSLQAVDESCKSSSEAVLKELNSEKRAKGRQVRADHQDTFATNVCAF